MNAQDIIHRVCRAVPTVRDPGMRFFDTPSPVFVCVLNGKGRAISIDIGQPASDDAIVSYLVRSLAE